jgi:hypothetical protein
MYLRIFNSLLSLAIACFLFAQNDLPNPINAELDKAIIFESKLSFRKKNYGGLLILKPIKNGLALTLSSKFGAKILDFVLYPDSLEERYVLEAVDKKALKKIIYKDFSMLHPILLNTKKIKNKKNKVVLKRSTKKYTYFYLEDNIVKIDKNIGLNTIEITYSEQELQEIFIKHKLIGLELKLTPLRNTYE